MASSTSTGLGSLLPAVSLSPSSAPVPITSIGSGLGSGSGPVGSVVGSAIGSGVTSGKETKRSPSEFLKLVLGRPVIVKLNSGVEFRGILACLDGYMNIAMEQTEEYVDGQLKTKYGDAFIRGNNVLYISTQKKRPRKNI